MTEKSTPIPKPVLAVAWLHRNKPIAYVITSRVKEIWLKVDPKMVENYTTPLYAEQPPEDTKSRLASHAERDDGDLAVTQGFLGDGDPSSAGPDALAKLIEKLEAWARSLEAEAVVEEYQPRREIFERRRDALRQACAALRSRPAQGEADPFADKYHELLLAVSHKCPGESRHETALRYIRNAEHPQQGTDAAMSQQEGK